MADRSELPTVAAVGIWLTSVVGFGVLAVAVLGAVFSDFVNCDITELTDPADTPLGWLIAVAASVLPAAVAGAVANARVRVPLVIAALAVAVFELWIWWWVLNPICQADLELAVAIP
ncbi:MAG: hypothetical protein OER95_10760 [Acidimicrobiia bacterium]|nr:hypothetical protein [Acidimicrobiia bacterium]